MHGTDRYPCMGPRIIEARPDECVERKTCMTREDATISAAPDLRNGSKTVLTPLKWDQPFRLLRPRPTGQCIVALPRTVCVRFECDRDHDERQREQEPNMQQ